MLIRIGFVDLLIIHPYLKFYEKLKSMPLFSPEFEDLKMQSSKVHDQIMGKILKKSTNLYILNRMGSCFFGRANESGHRVYRNHFLAHSLGNGSSFLEVYRCC